MVETLPRFHIDWGRGRISFSMLSMLSAGWARKGGDALENGDKRRADAFVLIFAALVYFGIVLVFYVLFDNRGYWPGLRATLGSWLESPVFYLVMVAPSALAGISSPSWKMLLILLGLWSGLVTMYFLLAGTHMFHGDFPIGAIFLAYIVIFGAVIAIAFALGVVGGRVVRNLFTKAE